jgi:uncharacterized damage-inducible protein DinB
MKLTRICLLGIGMACALVAQESANKTVVNELVKHWETSEALSLAVANAMPAENYDFKASSAEMSFGEQMNHIALANSSYCAAASGKTGPLTKKSQDNTKEAAVKNLTSAYDFCLDALKEMTDGGLQKAVTRGQSQTTAFELFWGGFTHAAHHRGQAEVYLRLKEITPPAYKF